MMFKGGGVRSKAVHDVLSKHKKDQKNSAYRLKKNVYTYTVLCVIQSRMQPQQTQRLGQICTLSTESACLTNFYCHGVHNWT